MAPPEPEIEPGSLWGGVQSANHYTMGPRLAHELRRAGRVEQSGLESVNQPATQQMGCSLELCGSGNDVHQIGLSSAGLVAQR